MTTRQEEIRKYFVNIHDNVCNQKYNKNLPYSFHLDMVWEQAVKFKHLVDIDSSEVIAGVFGHDSLEDARLTYNDVVDQFNKNVAEIIYLCTEFKGRTRKERHPLRYYSEMSVNHIAVFVKLCDVIANVKFSLLTNSSMFSKYTQEYKQWKPVLHRNDLHEMFEYLDCIFELKH